MFLGDSIVFNSCKEFLKPKSVRITVVDKTWINSPWLWLAEFLVISLKKRFAIPNPCLVLAVPQKGSCSLGFSVVLAKEADSQLPEGLRPKVAHFLLQKQSSGLVRFFKQYFFYILRSFKRKKSCKTNSRSSCTFFSHLPLGFTSSLTTGHLELRICLHTVLLTTAQNWFRFRQFFHRCAFLFQDSVQEPTLQFDCHVSIVSSNL